VVTLFAHPGRSEEQASTIAEEGTKCNIDFSTGAPLAAATD
jgi:hypothetical protein